MENSSRVRNLAAHIKLPALATLAFAVLLLVLLQVDTAKAGPKLDLSIPEVRAEYVANLAQRNMQAKTEAQSWAQRHGVPIRYDDGVHLFEIMYIRNNRPIYNTTHNVNSAISIATDLVRNTTPYNVNGNGLTEGIWDAGSVLSTHQEFGGRVNVMDGASSHYHSTHVGGTVGAAGLNPGALGMAPSITIDSYEWNNDNSEMAGRAASYPDEPGKIYTSNHSYGHIAGWVYTNWSGSWAYHWNPYSTWNRANSREENFGQYDSTAQTYDDVAYNAPYYLIFKSAGNDRSDNPSTGETIYYSPNGGLSWNSKSYKTSTCPPGDGIIKNGYDTITHVGVAKNVMTVGAVNDAVSGGSRDPASGTMSSFSSWGPADDGRIKPDIVANGVSLYSTDNDNDSDYTTLSGTSMSAPSASGSAMLLIHHYSQLHPGQAMLSSTLKGLIIHTADDLGNPGPDYSYGWGLMNIEAAAEFISQNKIAEALLDGDNTSDSYEFDLDGSNPIRMTLCWTEPPAGALNDLDNPSPRLINDMDLRIIGPGGSPTYYPYILNPASPSDIATTGDNTLDNIEQVYIAAPAAAGIYTVEVSYKGTLTNGEQYYSLISSEPFANSPPTANNGSASAQQGIAKTIVLNASDDGKPNPPGVLSYIIMSLPNYGSLNDPNANLISSDDIPYTLADNGNEVVYTSIICYTGSDSFDFKANDGGVPPDGGDSNVATISINVISVIYTASMDTDPGWSLDSGADPSKWEWGTPNGGGGQYGGPDPTSGYTDSNVIGYNLSGDYRNSIASTEWAATPAIDCSNYTNVQLKFYRWLNVELPTYDHAYVEVSNNGSSWNRIWENTQEITDSSWILQTFDISSTADEQPTVFIRWGMGPTDGSWQYSGWNIDDVELSGIISGTPGDFEPDCDVDFYDFTVLASAWMSSYGESNWNPICDISEPNDNVIDGLDLDVFSRNWLEGAN